MLTFLLIFHKAHGRYQSSPRSAASSKLKWKRCFDRIVAPASAAETAPVVTATVARSSCRRHSLWEYRTQDRTQARITNSGQNDGGSFTATTVVSHTVDRCSRDIIWENNTGNWCVTWWLRGKNLFVARLKGRRMWVPVTISNEGLVSQHEVAVPSTSYCSVVSFKRSDLCACQSESYHRSQV